MLFLKSIKHQIKSKSIATFTSIILLILPLISPAIAQIQNGNLSIKNKTIALGDSKINMIIYKNKQNPNLATFISLHNNEQTGITNLISRIISDGGILVILMPELSAEGDLCRFIKFKIEQNNYYVDPNRIFDDSRIVIYSSIDCLNNSGEELKDLEQIAKIIPKISVFSRNFLQILEVNQNKNRYLVAFHNNRDLHYNSSDLIADEACAKRHSSSQNIQDIINQSDFFYVNEEIAFNYFSEQDFNVVWQQEEAINNPLCNDGSLSIYAQANKIPYINLEVNYLGEKDKDEGNSSRDVLTTQKKASIMLNSLFEFLKTR